MAVVHERSLGPLYFARAEANRPTVPTHTTPVVEMVYPWRTGKALVFRNPRQPYRVLMVGLWWRTKPLGNELDEERWLAGRWLPISTEEISGWADGTEAEEATRI